MKSEEIFLVWVIEKDSDLALLFEECLQEDGFEVRKFDSIQVLKVTLRQYGAPKVTVVDVDGFSAEQIETVFEVLKGSKLICISSFSVEKIQKTLGSKKINFLKKPFKIETLLSEIRNFLNCPPRL